MEPNYLKCSNMQTSQPIQLRFASYAGFFVMNCADFGEYRSNGISTGAKGIILDYTSNGAEFF